MVTSKQLLPVYDKPLIYYPLSVLMMAGIKDILIITSPDDINRFKKLLGEGENFGIKLSYAIQNKPEGIAQAFIIGKKFIGSDACTLILGDNIFYGSGLIAHLNNAVTRAIEDKCATLYGCYNDNPSRYGVITLDKKNLPTIVEEKPIHPKSNYCVTGLYVFPNDVINLVKKIKKSKRDEYEITDLNNLYIKNKRCHLTILGRGFFWLDTGTYDSLIEAANYIKSVESHQGIVVCSPEEIAYLHNWISKKKLLDIAKKLGNTDYSKHLFNVANNKIIYATNFIKRTK